MTLLKDNSPLKTVKMQLLAKIILLQVGHFNKIRNDEMNVKIKITPGSCQVQDKFECLFVDEPRYEHC